MSLPMGYTDVVYRPAGLIASMVISFGFGLAALEFGMVVPQGVGSGSRGQSAADRKENMSGEGREDLL